MSGSRLSMVMLGLGLAAGTLPAASAGPGPTCTFSGDVVVDPGLSGAPSSGSFETPPGEDGSYTCRYSYGPSKSGAAGAEGRYGTADADSCTDGGEGEGNLRLGRGDDAGNDFTFTYSPFSEDGVATGEFHSERISGTLTLTAVDGDCAPGPVTRVHLQGEGELRP